MLIRHINRDLNLVYHKYQMASFENDFLSFISKVFQPNFSVKSGDNFVFVSGFWVVHTLDLRKYPRWPCRSFWSGLELRD